MDEPQPINSALPTADNAQPPASVPASSGDAPPSAEELKAALKAFKKRIKLTQLDQDSRVGRSPTTSGRTTIAAMSPPSQYPRAVWDALVAEGKLKYAGQGMYELR